MYYVCVLFVTVSAGSCTHSLHTGGTVQWKSITLMCRPTFRGKNPFLVKIQYVDGCKGECIIYLQRCRNYNKLLVVPTDSLNSVGAHELLTLIDTEYDCMDDVIITCEFASQSVWMFLILQLFCFIKYLQSDNVPNGAEFHTMFY